MAPKPAADAAPWTKAAAERMDDYAYRLQRHGGYPLVSLLPPAGVKALLLLHRQQATQLAR